MYLSLPEHARTWTALFGKKMLRCLIFDLKQKQNKMIKWLSFTFFVVGIYSTAFSQHFIPLDTTHWEISAKAYVLEHYKGKDAIYLHQGMAVLKDSTFLNGSIEFDVYLTKRQSFPGVRFRVLNENNMESFYLRPHQSGNPDANQAAPVINGLTAWQLYFGPSYSFAYDYNFDGWTHIKIVVNEARAQVYLDYAEKPQLSWHLQHAPQTGKIAFGGSFAPMHYANFKIDKTDTEIVDFTAIEKDPLQGIVREWQISDKFKETDLNDPAQLKTVINDRIWGKRISVEENTAVNISKEILLNDGSPGNTVFAKITIQSNEDQIKFFEFGYSDRVVAILNGQAIYRGTNKFRSRDYRYLGTIGLFDGVYLDLEKGENTLLLAVSEDFGGWLVTGRFKDKEGISVK